MRAHRAAGSRFPASSSPAAARPWTAADGAEGGFALKVGLARLLPREAPRDQIERTAEALQALALRGSLVATTVALEELRQL
jgi:hypothetical protein